jgi:hypothetical protein
MNDSNGEFDGFMEEIIANERSTAGITLEQLLLAANVLSSQNPQGASFDRRALLREAFDFAMYAQSQIKETSHDVWRSKKTWFGYDQPNKFEFIPYRKAAISITGLKTEKQAVARFKAFVEGYWKLLGLEDSIRRYGVRKDLIPSLSEEEKQFFDRRIKRQNQASAKLARKKSKKSS